MSFAFLIHGCSRPPPKIKGIVFVSGATTIDFMSDFKPRDFDPDPPISDATPNELVLDMNTTAL